MVLAAAQHLAAAFKLEFPQKAPFLAMHPALEIEELRIAILQQCYPAELYRLAMTSKLFTETALDMLYGSSFIDKTRLTRILLACVPSNICTIWKSVHHDRARVVKEATFDWTRFDACARRIRKLQLQNPDRRDTLLFEGLALANQTRSGPLYPFLRSLEFSRSRNDIIHESTFPLLRWLPYLPSYISPTLETLAINLDGPPFEVVHKSLLVLTQTKFAQLKELTIDGRLSAPQSRALFSELLLRLQGLERLAGPIPADSWPNLASRPNLKHISCPDWSVVLAEGLVFEHLPSLSVWEQDRSRWPQSGGPRFHALTKIGANGCSEFLTSLGASIQNSPLQSISLKATERYDRISIATCIAALPSLSNQSTLSSFSFSSYEGPPDAVLLMEDLHPILRFRNLKQLDLSFLGGLNLSDDDMTTFASSFPHLTHLKFHSQKKDPSRLTLHGLAALTACPHLESLTLRLDATVPPPDPATLKGAPHRTLKELYIRESSIQSPDVVFDFLHAVFPGLIWFTTFPVEPEYAEQWKEVEVAFQSVMANK